MFFSKKTSVNLTKLYFVVSESDGAIDLNFISDDLFKFCINPPVKYALNYGVDQAISKFRGQINLSKFEYLEVVDTHGNSMLSVRKQLKNEGGNAVFQIMLLSMLDKNFSNERKIIECVKSRHDLIYGYSRGLRSDFLPTSETKIKTGLFGIKVVSEKPGVWLFEQSEIETGAVKGIYPLNYWTRLAIQKLEGAGFRLLENASNNEIGVYFFDESMQRDILAKNPRFKDYLRFDDLGTD